MSDDNTRNEFVVDDAKHHEDLQDLAALKRVKDAISKKKRQIKDKDYLNKHPDLQDLVDAHRTRKIVRKEPDKEGGKIKLELQEKQSVKADLGQPPPKPKPEVDYDKLAELIYTKMEKKAASKAPKAPKAPKASKPEKEFDSDSDDEPTSTPKILGGLPDGFAKPASAPTPEKKFNESLPKTQPPKPKVKHIVAVGGKWF
mgnify:FL=1